MTPSWFLNFRLKYVFLSNLGAFQYFRFFLIETLGWVCLNSVLSYKRKIGKISAQPHTTLCIQFLDRENSDKNNTLPLGKQISFTLVWGRAEILPKNQFFLSLKVASTNLIVQVCENMQIRVIFKVEVFWVLDSKFFRMHLPREKQPAVA